MIATLRIFGMLVMKDIRSEIRGRHFLVSSVAFGVLLMLVFGMALGGERRLSPEYSSGILWTALFFLTAVSLNRYDVSDREHSGWVGLALAPIDRSLLYYAKWTSTFLFLFASNLTICVAFFVILNQSLPIHLASFIGILCCGSLGMSGVGTFLTTLVSQSTMKDVLVPITMFPLSIPLFLALIHITMYSFGRQVSGVAVWVEVTLGYIVCICVLPWLLFEALMEV